MAVRFIDFWSKAPPPRIRSMLVFDSSIIPTIEGMVKNNILWIVFWIWFEKKNFGNQGWEVFLKDVEES